MASAADLPPLPRFDVRHEDLEAAVVVTVSGEVDAATVPAMRSALDTASAEAKTRLVVDLRRVSYLDSLGITVLARAFDALNARGIEVAAVCGTQTAVLLDSLGLGAEIAIVGSREQALVDDSLGQAQPPAEPEQAAPAEQVTLRAARRLIESGRVPDSDPELMALRFVLEDEVAEQPSDG